VPPVAFFTTPPVTLISVASTSDPEPIPAPPSPPVAITVPPEMVIPEASFASSFM